MIHQTPSPWSLEEASPGDEPDETALLEHRKSPELRIGEHPLRLIEEIVDLDPRGFLPKQIAHRKAHAEQPDRFRSILIRPVDGSPVLGKIDIEVIGGIDSCKDDGWKLIFHSKFDVLESLSNHQDRKIGQQRVQPVAIDIELHRTSHDVGVEPLDVILLDIFAPDDLGEIVRMEPIVRPLPRVLTKEERGDLIQAEQPGEHITIEQRHDRGMPVAHHRDQVVHRIIGMQGPKSVLTTSPTFAARP